MQNLIKLKSVYKIVEAVFILSLKHYESTKSVHFNFACRWEPQMPAALKHPLDTIAEQSTRALISNDAN